MSNNERIEPTIGNIWVVDPEMVETHTINAERYQQRNALVRTLACHAPVPEHKKDPDLAAEWALQYAQSLAEKIEAAEKEQEK